MAKKKNKVKKPVGKFNSKGQTIMVIPRDGESPEKARERVAGKHKVPMSKVTKM